MARTVTPAPLWVRTPGAFFFKYRNLVFPVVLVLLVLVFGRRSWVGETWDNRLDLIGLAVALAGQTFRAMVIGLAYIKRGGLNKKVHAETLVTEGMFSACRNPLYVGNALILAGLGFIFHDPIGCLIAAAFFAFAYWSIIRTEETFLLEKFGDAYRDYCRHVPRWWPDPRRVVDAFRGARFNWRRVVMKDYGTFAGWVISALLLETVDELRRGGGFSATAAAPYAATIVLVLLMALGVRQLKKTGRLREAA
jgi:protein-S-isoprenylcysteine O-methyltransferase Ste14